jgi:replication factor C large subunit
MRKMLINKYKPENCKGVLGQDIVVKTINNWLDGWKQGDALLLYGPTGVGKTLIANVIARERKMRLIEINTSESRNEESLKKITEMLKQKTISLSNIVLIDEMDCLFREDSNCSAEIIRIIEESKYPVILTANNPYDQKLRSIREKCRLLKMSKIDSATILKKLKEISFKEKSKVSEDVLRKIAVNSRGDMRSAINDLEVATKGKFEISSREKEVDIFNLLRLIFKTRDIKKITEALDNSDKDIDEIFLWLEHNIANEYEKPEEIAEAFDILSKADLQRSRIIKNQNYRFEKYAKDMIANISLVKKKIYNKFTSYKYPSRLVMLGQSKQDRMEKGLILEKLAKELHCSKRTVNSQLPYLEALMNSFKDMDM